MNILEELIEVDLRTEKGGHRTVGAGVLHKSGVWPHNLDED